MKGGGRSRGGGGEKREREDVARSSHREEETWDSIFLLVDKARGKGDYRKVANVSGGRVGEGGKVWGGIWEATERNLGVAGGRGKSLRWEMSSASEESGDPAGV